MPLYPEFLCAGSVSLRELLTWGALGCPAALPQLSGCPEISWHSSQQLQERLSPPFPLQSPAKALSKPAAGRYFPTKPVPQKVPGWLQSLIMGWKHRPWDCLQVGVVAVLFLPSP